MSHACSPAATSQLGPGVAGTQMLVTLLTVPNDALSDRLAEMFGERLVLDLCCCSVLDECWDLQGPRSRCPTPKVPFKQ